MGSRVDSEALGSWAVAEPELNRGEGRRRCECPCGGGNTGLVLVECEEQGEKQFKAMLGFSSRCPGTRSIENRGC